MNTADIIILFLILLFAITGFVFGFIRFSVVYIKWCGSFAASFFGAPLLNNSLKSVLQVQELWLFIISFISIFLFSFTVLTVVCNRWMFHTKKTTHEHWLNKTTGVFAGLFTGILLSAFTYHIITASYWKEGAAELNESVIASTYEQQIGNHAETLVNSTLSSAEGLQVAGVASSSEKENFQTTSFSSDMTKAVEMLQLVNKERELINLQPLQLNAELSMAAKLHGADMFTRGYFSHTTPEGKDPFRRLDELKIAYKYAGENLAYSYSIIRAHTALMKSPGHRANILNPKFSKIGISVLDGGRKGLMVVQEFKN
jgi:uncharacterized protein YkwD